MNSQEQKKSSTPTAETGSQEGLVDQAKHMVTAVAGQAVQQVQHQVEAPIGKAVEKISGVAEALRTGSHLLKNVGPLGDVSGRAADGLEGVAHFFENKDLGDVVRDVQRYARREPAIFLGGAFALGLLAGRFLKSTASRDEQELGFSGYRGSRDEGWSGSARDEGFLPSDELEDYESQRFGQRGSQFRSTQPMASRAPVTRTRISGETGYHTTPSIDSLGSSPTKSPTTTGIAGSSGTTTTTGKSGSIKPSPIVNAGATSGTSATLGTSGTSPMPATQGSPGAGGSTPSTTGPGNGNTGRS